MPSVRSNGLEIAYEDIGSGEGRPLFLIMGLGVSLVFWEDEFCAMLAERGHRVVRFDNRDVGRSTKLDALGVPNVMEAMTALATGRQIAGPYLLTDMARDTIGLMDALGIERAHVVGASMGGMIAQTMAIEHPQRLRSMTSIMSTTGSPSVPTGKPEAMAMLVRPPVFERSAYVDQAVEIWRTIGSPGFPLDEQRVRDRAAAHFDRGYHPAGIARQLVAVVASGDRTEALRKVSMPSLVIHGVADPLVPVEGGKATAAAIPGASLLLIEGMGHDMPREVWPQIVGAITELTATHG
jgi:pimeloyl-ACP methyl ester carboxylesterase